MNKEDLPALLNTPNYEPERAGGRLGREHLSKQGVCPIGIISRTTHKKKKENTVEKSGYRKTRTFCPTEATFSPKPGTLKLHRKN